MPDTMSTERRNLLKALGAHHFGSLLVFLFQGDKPRDALGHFSKSGIELASSAGNCFVAETDDFAVSDLFHAFEETTGYFLCRCPHSV